jgi:mannose-1-phosphate guanylyltransferase
MYVVIMCGGAGKRFWPKSRESFPKQFLNIAGEESILKDAYRRAKKVTGHDKVFVVTGEKFKSLIKKDLPEIDDANIICEPDSKNTAPCIALSLYYLKNFFGEDDILFIPADHLINDSDDFKKTVMAASMRMKKNSGVAIFGIKPRYAETGYGYIKKGKLIEKIDGKTVTKVLGFTEKPPLNKAGQYLKSGQYLWNSGMFLFSMKKLENSFRKSLPKIYESFSKFDFGDRKSFCSDKIKSLYSKLEPISIDYGIIEKEGEIEVIECTFYWSDIGSWNALEEIWPKDKEGNAVRGKYFAKNSKSLIADTGGKLLVSLGVKDLVLVETDDIIFICNKDSVDKMKDMLDEMKEKGFGKYL